MHKILMVIRREYLDRVRKKSFWIGILIFPVLMVALIVLPVLSLALSSDDQKKIAVVDATGRLLEPLEKELQSEKLPDGQPQFVFEAVPVKGSVEETRRALEPRIVDGEIFGILTVGEDLNADGNFQFYGRNIGNITTLRRLESALQKTVVELRMEQLQLAIDRATLEKLTADVDIQPFQVTEAGKATQKGFRETYFGTFIFVFILFMSLLLYGIAVMRGILEEKSSRVMEVLLGSLTPNQLMTGKILGIGLVGLTQLVVYVIAAVGVQLYFLSRSGGPGGGDMAWIADMISPVRMIYFVIFFLFGYFMYTSLYAAVGAVCNSEQEAQNLQAPVQWTLMLPMLLTIFFVNDPDSTIATVVSLIPIFSPMVMFMRINLVTPPFWQIALSILLMAVTTVLLFLGVARIFRIGVLMYGKRPTIPEIMRWARS